MKEETKGKNRVLDITIVIFGALTTIFMILVWVLQKPYSTLMLMFEIPCSITVMILITVEYVIKIKKKK